MPFLLWIYPQVTPNAGKTSVYQETPITWWAPTVCPCWSTTSEESNSWSVTEPFSQFLCSGGGICTTLSSINSFHFALTGWNVLPPLKKKKSWKMAQMLRSALFFLFWFFLPFLSLGLPFSLPFGAWRLAKNNWIDNLMKKSNGMHDLCHRQSRKKKKKVPFCSLFFSK